MAAQKVFRRVFSDFKGLNLNSSVLVRQPDEAIEMVNLEVADDFSLRMRDGCTLLGQPIRCMGITNYVVGGVEQLVCYGIENRHLVSGYSCPHLYRLVTANMTVTRVAGSTSWNVYFFMDPDFGQWRIQLSQGGVIAYDAFVGTGLSSTPVTLNTVAAAIDVLPNFTALVDWTWTPTSTASGLTFPVAANPFPFPELRGIYFPDAPVTANGIQTRWRYLKSAAGLNLTVEGAAGDFNVSWVNGNPVGLGTLPAATIVPRSPEIGEQSASSTLSIPFQYWEPIPSHRYSDGAIVQEITPSGFPAGGVSPASFRPVNFTQSRNVLYFSGNQKVGSTVSSSTHTASYTRSDFGTPTPILVQRGMHKYDGTFAYMTSNYYEPLLLSALHNAGFAATWTLGATYKYRFIIRSKDAQGNVVVASSILPASFTIANAAQAVQLNIQTRGYLGQESGIVRSSLYTSAGSTAAAITLSGAGNNAIFRVGDRVAILGPDPTLGFPWTSRFGTVSAWNGATGTVTCSMDTGNYVTVPSGARTVSSFIAANECVLEVYRTKANGNIFYLAGQIPLYYDTTPQTTFVDDVLDANLGRVYDGPVDDFGNPTLNLCLGIGTSLASHQGVVAHIGETDALRWDDADFIERWIPARAELEIASTTPGQVTGLVSDQNSQLIVTKPDAIISVAGSLPENQAVSSVIVENFRGTGNQASLIPVLGQIFGCGRNGPFLLTQGQLQTEFANRIQSLFSFGAAYISAGVSPGTLISGFALNTDFSRLTASPDVTKHRVIFSHPDKSYCLYYDYLYNVWGTFTGYTPQHGGTTYDRNFVFGSRIDAGNTNGAIFKRTYGQAGSDFYRFFNDNGLPIEIKLTLGFDDLDTPNVAKEFQWFRPYFAPVESPSFAVDTALSYYNSSLVIYGYKNYRFNIPSTTIQDTFPGDPDDWQAQSKVWRFRSELVNSLALGIYATTAVLNKPFILSGYDMMVSPSTQADSISR